jgi:hypothetical protein
MCTEDRRLVKKEEIASWKERGIELKPNFWALKDVGGFGHQASYADGTKTVYYYSPTIATTIPVPEFLMRIAMKSSLPKYMYGVKKRVESGGTYSLKK